MHFNRKWHLSLPKRAGAAPQDAQKIFILDKDWVHHDYVNATDQPKEDVIQKS
jgi:hypothetical protein